MPSRNYASVAEVSNTMAPCGSQQMRLQARRAFAWNYPKIAATLRYRPTFRPNWSRKKPRNRTPMPQMWRISADRIVVRSALIRCIRVIRSLFHHSQV